MQILYPIQMALTGGKWKDEITDLAIMGQAGAALNGTTQYIQTTEDIYQKFCYLRGYDFWPHLVEIINDGGEVMEVEVYLLLPESMLTQEVPEGIRYNLGGENYDVPTKWGNWNDGGTNPLFQTVDNHFLFRTNLGGNFLSYQEIKIVAALEGVELLTQAQASELINSNSPEL